MPRLYLILLVFLGNAFFTNAQTEIGKYLKYAEEQFQKGDYYSALDLYKKALAIDSNSVAVNWAYAETLRAYKDYRNAEKYYQIVYEKEEALIYPSSLLQLGLMQKQNGKYDEAIETFKLAKKKYARQKKDYLYLKSRRELESCLWAKTAIENKDLTIEPIAGNVNTPNAEFGHVIIDSILIFSSLKADSISTNEEVFDKSYRTHLYQKNLKVHAENPKVEAIDQLFEKSMSSGNGIFSLDGNRFYYSLCKENDHNYSCKIMVANYKNGKWSKPDSLGEIINVSGANTTMPCIANWENNEYLIFSSDRNGGEGGLDLWYSQIKNGNQYSKARNIKNLNSPDNETSPFWDESQKTLYFSSSWWDGLGGLDVFSSQFLGSLQNPENAGLPINSPANDLYFFKYDEKEYVTSNRLGVQFSKNPTCCSDIFVLDKPLIVPPPTQKETLEELNKRLPVTLYFHNDVPNPKSTEIATNVNYIDSYQEYKEMLEKYQKEYSSGLTGEKADEAKEDIESFFIEYVDQGVKDLNLFRDLLLEELQKGRKINLTIKGFASPLAKSDYNVNLTKRRISSLVNYLSAFNEGVFVPYLQDNSPDGGKLTFTEVPFGEYTSNKLVSDNLNDQKNSVYSRAAGLERKIEIQLVNFIEDSIVDLPLEVKTNIENVGIISPSKKVSVSYTLTNSNDHTVTFLPPRIPCECSEVSIDNKTLKPGESTQVHFTFDPNGYAGNVVKSIYLKTAHSEEEIRLILSAEVEK
ncbi:MAG: DUF1573 domain-containing protein [Crocinitomicaceae bacterium]